jgi:hypothetical protein
MSETARSRGFHRAAAVAGFLFVLGLAAWVRVAQFADPLAGGELVALDGDCHYHVRRIEAALQGGIPTLDPLMNWPQGGLAHWADGFDLLGAWFATLAGGGRSNPGTHVAVFLWPVVLGILAVWATIDLARRLVPRRDHASPLAAGLVAAFVPYFVDASTIGRVDHHVAEALSLLVLLSWSLRRFPVEGEDPPGIGWEAAGAVAVWMALWVFSGGEFYVALAAVPLGLAALGSRGGIRVVGSGAPALVGGAILGAVASVPSMRVHGRLLSFIFPSLMQPMLVALAGLALATAVVAGGRPGSRDGRRRPLARLGAALVVLLLAFAIVPGLWREVRGAIEGWMLHRDPWIASIAEFQPLFWDRDAGRWTMIHVDALLGPVGILGALALPVGTWVAWRHSPARAASFAMAAGVISTMAVLQIRFVRIVVPLLAIAIALSLRGLGDLLARVPVARRLAGVMPVLGAVAIVLSSRELRSQVHVGSPRDVPAFAQAVLDLKLDRPPVHGRREGVLVPWDTGHAAMQLSGRPVASNGFGSYMDPESFAEVRDAFQGKERRLVATMEKHDLGHVIGGGFVLSKHLATPSDEGPVAGDPPALNVKFMRRTPLSQLLIAGSGLPAAQLPHLERLMPVRASQAVAGGLSFPLPIVWTYELVPGARITGRAAPGTMVVGEIGLEEWGRAHRYRAWTVAGPDGRWVLAVALPSGFLTHTLRTAPSWRIIAGDGPPVDLSVPEEAVREGREIAVP